MLLKMARRCQCIIYDKDLGYTRNCRNSCKFETKAKNYCYIHAVPALSGRCVQIQSVYKSHRTRKKIDKLFVDLPRELQQKVIHYMREPLYLKRVHDKITSYIYPKITLFLEDLDFAVIIFSKTESIYDYLSRPQLNYCYYLLRILTKYYKIINKKKIQDFINVCNTLEINYVISTYDNSIYKTEWLEFLDLFKKFIQVLK